MKLRIVRTRVACAALGLTSAAGALAGCASAPPAPAQPLVRIEQKTAWMLQLEDQRILRVPPPPPVVDATAGRDRRRARATPPPPPPPDLGALIKDTDSRVRRRAALAIGRVGLPEGVQLLVPALLDADPDVRAMAAFALGLLGDVSAEAALTPLLTDPSPLVRGRAAEALGSIGAKAAAPPIGQMVGEYARAAPVTAMQPDDETWPAAPEAEAFKLGLFALVRLKEYEPLASAVLAGGRPVTAWWPVAYALQRMEDKRAVPALLQLLNGSGRYTVAFAARGLGAHKEASAVDALLAQLEPSRRAPLEVVVSSVRALGQIADPRAAETLARLAGQTATHPNVRLEAITALGAMRADAGLPVVQDMMTDEWAAMRSAAIAAAAAIDPDTFLIVLAGMEPDRDWRVRAALARVLATLPPETVTDRVRQMLSDEDKRVIPAVMGALARLKAPDIADVLRERLADPDFAVRSAAAGELGRLKPDGGAAWLREAYKTAQADSAYDARAAAIGALAEYGAAEAIETLKLALTDKDWAVRLRAASLLAKLDPSVETRQAIRPAPGGPIAPYDDPQLAVPDFSPHAFIETAKGTIELELAVLDAPQTARNFMALARKGFFNGLQVHRVVPNFVVQDGDPRGDGGGGPGYTIRDELNERPYLRGTVGMALAGADTGGSQFFITHSPQPHLDARYTVFGHVVNGMDVVDRIQQGDVIQRVRVWDGKAWQ